MPGTASRHLSELERALSAIKRERPDVVFLKIQMPVIIGFELLSMIDEEIMPVVGFVTAYDEYALKAFEENAVDYRSSRRIRRD